MARTAFTADAIFALESAIAKGVLSVRYPDGTTTTYRSIDEMLKILDLAKASAGLKTKGQGRRYADHSKGF